MALPFEIQRVRFQNGRVEAVLKLNHWLFSYTPPTLQLYPVAYAAPALLQFGVSYEFTIVSQQVIYTIADIASKVIYGIMLTVTASMLSEAQGFSAE